MYGYLMKTWVTFDLHLSTGKNFPGMNLDLNLQWLKSRCGHPVHAQCLVGLERDEEGPGETQKTPCGFCEVHDLFWVGFKP